MEDTGYVVVKLPFSKEQQMQITIGKMMQDEKKLINIGSSAFYGTALEKVEFLDGLELIVQNAFYEL